MSTRHEIPPIAREAMELMAAEAALNEYTAAAAYELMREAAHEQGYPASMDDLVGVYRHVCREFAEADARGA